MSGDQMPSAALPRIMRAVQVGAFGGVEQLHLSSIPVPTPRRGEVLVKVGAAGVGPWDTLVREGSSGLALTLPVTPSADLSDGVAVGGGVNDLAPGDAVFGVTKDRFIGAYAEFALADASHLARRPVGLGFIEAGGMLRDVERAFQDCNISTKETNDRGENYHEGDRGDGPGCGNGRDEAD
jgi:NADPH:quinone reductase-like Zn-dependent oxidoreductase